MTTPLNVVEDRACPAFAHVGPMAVFEHIVRWACGHTRSLPPLRMHGGRPPRVKGETK